MYIQSLTWHLDDEQEVVTSKRALRAALSEILQEVEVDLSHRINFATELRG